MKIISEKKALEQLDKIKTIYRNEIQSLYETKAKNCLTCETKGACCVDEHFVNVQISRLEAVSILNHIKNSDADKQTEISHRTKKIVEKYDLKNAENAFAKTFACPLFEKERGCLIHPVKPVPCIQHACYERREDLPPDELQFKTEEKISALNEKTYRRKSIWLPLPVWLDKILNSEK